MKDQRISAVEISIEEIDRELIARGAQIPGEKLFNFEDKEGTPQREAVMKQVKEVYDRGETPVVDERFRHISTWELVQKLMLKTCESGGDRGIWNVDDRMDVYEVAEEQVKENARSTAAICMKSNLTTGKKGLTALKVKNYGKTFNLCDCEPFNEQPVSKGPLCTGFLVKEDIVATAGHFVNENNVRDLRIIFDYKMSDSSTPVTQVPNEDVYKGVEIIRRVYRREGNRSDWALVKLDRKASGRPVTVLSEKVIYCDQPVYVIGHPVGLPLKYAPGACICGVDDAYFTAELDIYSGNSGSPVFDGKTHEVIGMVVRGDNRDFRWTGRGWLSVIYPNMDIYSTGAQCTKVSEFLDYCR